MCDVKFCRDHSTEIIINIKGAKKELCGKCWTAMCNGKVCTLCLDKINITPLKEYINNFSGFCNSCKALA